MNQDKKNIIPNEGNLLQLVTFRFLPYWPLLAFFIVICFIGATAYMRFALPTYEATAILLVKDEKKGTDDSRMIESLNVFDSKKIVENEIEVMHSRSLMKEVVKDLGLYAPVSMEGKVRILSAYNTSPVAILVKDPEKIVEAPKVYFQYDPKSRSVKMENNTYPMNTWVSTSYGELQFIPNNKLKVATTYPLFFSLIPTKKIVTDLVKKLNVNAANKLSSVVILQFVDEVPERAEDILNELIHAYNRAGINNKNALADNTMQFVDDRLTHVKVDIDSIEKQIQMYRSDQGAVNLSEQSSMFLKNVGDNDQKVAMIEMQLAVLSQVQKFVSSGKSIGTIVPSTMGLDDPILAQLLNRLSTAELEYEKLKNTTADNNPVLISLSNELKQLKSAILESIRIQQLNLKSSRDQLNQTNKNYSTQLLSIPEKERKLLEISRQQTIINNVYDFLLQKKEETALSYAATVPDSRVLDVAESAIKPVSPQKTIAFGVALVLSFVSTIVIIYLKDFANSKILFRSELNTLTAFPVLGELPYVKKSLDVREKKEAITQQLFKIIATLGLFGKHNTSKKILITSTMGGEGKSFISLNLAKVLAAEGKKVVIIDLDFEKSTISNTYSLEKGNGIAEFLRGEREPFDIIQSTEDKNVCVVKSGELHSNHAELFSSDRVDYLLSVLEQSFDIIITDTSFIDPITSDLILTQFGDTILYVVRHAYTAKALFQLEIDNKKLSDPKYTGIVFNGVKPRGFFKGYGYGYGYEHSYQKAFIKGSKQKSKTELPKAVNS